MDDNTSQFALVIGGPATDGIGGLPALPSQRVTHFFLSPASSCKTAMQLLQEDGLLAPKQAGSETRDCDGPLVKQLLAEVRLVALAT